MGLRCIAILVALSLLSSAGAAASGRDACNSTMGCCASADSDARGDHGCDAGADRADRAERACCCIVQPPAALAAAAMPTMVTQDQQPLAPRWAAVADWPAERLAAGPADRSAGRLQSCACGSPPTSASLLSQRIALLL